MSALLETQGASRPTRAFAQVNVTSNAEGVASNRWLITLFLTNPEKEADRPDFTYATVLRVHIVGYADEAGFHLK
jgi:hypothetical protein